MILSFNLTGYLIYQFFVDFNAHCYSPFWSINDKRLHKLNYILSQMDPLLGEISLDGLHQIYDTTFDCIWQEIESDLPINNRSNGRGQSFRFKSRKHKAEKEKQKMREMAQAEFSILAATMATEIAYKQVNKQNQLRRLGGG